VNILLGLTGSVASTLAPKIVKKLQELGEVRVVCTDSSINFFDDMELEKLCKIYTDRDEWTFGDHRPVYQKDDPVLHIELRDWADVLVIAPLSANTLAKMTNGICDNLLTSIYRAWRPHKPVIVAPAMNTQMWENVITKVQVTTLTQMGRVYVVQPVKKVLACGEEGMGAMAHIDTIHDKIKKTFDLKFPLKHCHGIPIYPHLGSYNVERKFKSRHGGVDLYTYKGAEVSAMEDGEIIDIDKFTGEHCGSPWWNNTWAVYVKGYTGVICYGEIDPCFVKKGDRVIAGQILGRVLQVLKDDALRPDIKGYSLSMLHLEIYKNQSGVWNYDNKERLDPTPFLLSCRGVCPTLDATPITERWE